MYDIFLISTDTVNENIWLEFKYRFPNAQKIDNCDTFDKVKSKSFTSMFWVVWDDLEISENFELANYRATKWDDMYIHVFKNRDAYDGVCLFPKSLNVSLREFKSRFYVNKKEIDIVASNPRQQMFDIVFISYNETNADENFSKLCKNFPRAKRIHGVKGIHQAHIEAAKIVETEMFWIVDADAELENNFSFDYYVPVYERNHVHVWRSKNPINGLEYGYGGVKLFPTKSTLQMNTDTTDMTTSISKYFKAMDTVSNMTAFNTDPFNTWKSAFRECVKLSSGAIDRHNKKETAQRLKVWTTIGADKKYGEYALAGAKAGMEFGADKSNNLKLINDFAWLEEKFHDR